MIKKGLLFSLPILAVIAATSVYGWTVIEPGAQIASHWDANGNVNGYSSKETALLLMPGMAVFLVLLFSILPLADPRKENLYKSAAFYLTGWIGALVLLAAVHVMTVRSAVTGTPPDIAIVNVIVGAFFAVIGNFMAKSRSNWFAGVRTPWSLSSEHAWKAANRTTGWLFVLTGLGAIATTYAASPRMGVGVMLAGAITAALAGVIVSYFAWRSDPERAR